MLIKICIGLLGVFTVTHGAFEKLEAGAGPMAMGKACVAIPDLPYAIFFNPANIPGGHFQLSMDYQNYYGIKDLNQVDLVVNLPIRSAPISLGLSSFGNTLYRELQMMTAGVFRIASKFSLGLSLQYYFCSIKGYGSQATWGFNLGLAYVLIDKIKIGSMITNINQPTISRAREKLPQTFSIGINYGATPLLSLNLELFQDSRYKQEYRFGADYHLSSFMHLRAGIIDRVNNFSGGCSLAIGTFVFEYALVSHQTLGASHITSLLFTL
jgi:hypothetical protein